MEVKSTAKAFLDGTLLERAFEGDAPAKRTNGRKIQQTRVYAGILARTLIGLLKFLLLIMGFLFFWKIFDHAYVSDRFALSEVAVQGNQYVQDRQVEDIVRKEFPSALLRIDLKRLQERIEGEPWVQRAEVRRVLPGKILIQVVERAPKAVAVVDGAFYLVDSDGVILTRYEPGLGKFDLPILKGLLTSSRDNYLEENKKRAALFFKIITAIDGDGVQRSKGISELDVRNVEDPVFLPMNESVAVHLGDRDFLQRYLNFTNHLAEYQGLKEKNGPIESIDLRYENQVVFTSPKAP